MSISFKLSSIESKEFIGNDFQYNGLYSDDDDDGSERRIIKTTLENGISKSMIGSSTNNSLISSAYLSFSNHYEYSIRPDDIWIGILVQFTFYINNHKEELRYKFVDFNESKRPYIKNYTNFINNNNNYQPYEIIKDIVSLYYIKDGKSLLEWTNEPFSTTKNDDTNVSSILLMKILNNYFEYIFVDSNFKQDDINSTIPIPIPTPTPIPTGPVGDKSSSSSMTMDLKGIPIITLLGTPNDWINLKKRIEKLKEFDYENNGEHMLKWYNMLCPIIDQLIITANGKPSINWWNDMGHTFGGDPIYYITGWITALCCFDNVGNWAGGNNVLIDHYVCATDWVFVNANEIPNGYLFTPVRLNDNHGNEYEIDYYAGHFTVSTENNNNKSIKSNIDWCILLK